MLNSKISISILNISFLIGSLSLIGCSLPKPQKADQQQVATFNVELKDPYVIGLENHAEIAIPKSKTVQFDACITDVLYGKPVNQHHFLIRGNNKDQNQDVDVQTNAHGCLSWTEKFEFNALTDATYVTIHREIIAKGFQKGSRIVGALFNPWEGKISAIKDLRVSELPDGKIAQARLNGIDKEGKKKIHGIWVKTGFISVSQTKAADLYHFDIQLDPKIVLKNAVGEEIVYPVSIGKFQAKIFLISSLASGAKENRLLLAQSESALQAEAIGGIINLSTQLKIPEICSLGQLELGIELTPQKGPEHLGPSTGIYSLGHCDSLIGKQALRLKGEVDNYRQAEAFSVSQYVEGNLPVAGVTSGAGGAQAGGLQSGQSAVSSTSDGRSTDLHENLISTQIKLLALTPTHLRYQQKEPFYIRERIFNIDICLENFDRRGFRAQSFEVTGVSGKKLKPAQTLNNGCLRVEDSIEFNYFAPECLLRRYVEISSKSLNFNKKVLVEINPQNENSLFFQDLSVQGKDNLGLGETCAKGKSNFLTTGYSFDKVRYTYSLDQTLGLNIHKTGILKLFFEINRPSLSSSRGLDDKYLPGGTYRLKWAIVDIEAVRNNTYKDHIYAAGEKDVEVAANSNVVTEVPMSMTNIKAIGNTNYVYFELSPSGLKNDESIKDLEIPAFRGPISLIRNGDGNNLEIVHEEKVLDKLIATYKEDYKNTLAQANVESEKTYFAKEANIQIIDINKVKTALGGLTQAQLKDWVDKGEVNNELRSHLCNYWMTSSLSHQTAPSQTARKGTIKAQFFNFLLNACLSLVKNDPRQFFDIEYRYYLKNISKVQQLPGSYRDFSISQGFALQRGHTITNSHGWSRDLGLGFRLPEFFSLDKIPLLNWISASAGARFNWSKSDANSGGSGNSVTISTGMSALVETINLKIVAQEYEKCAVIKLNDNLFLAEDSTSHFVKNNLADEELIKMRSLRYMICQGQMNKSPIVFDESYYILTQKAAETSSMDPIADSNRNFFIALRGRADFVSFMSLLYNGITVPDSFKSDYQQSHLLNDPIMPIFLRGLRNYPGQIIAPR